jgi:AMME syndrome candidate gene 1 protein
MQCTIQHCVTCFEALISAFNNEVPILNPLESDSNVISVPMFVTLKKNTGDGKKPSVLRGCIGTLTPRPLSELRIFAIKSAFEDRRFSPLEKHELQFCEITVSLLVKYEPGKDYLDWDISIHGIIIEFEIDSKSYKSTFLPGVVLEMNWNKQTSIDKLIVKSGFNGLISKSLYNSIRLTRYQSSKQTLSYAEFMSRKKSI